MKWIYLFSALVLITFFSCQNISSESHLSSSHSYPPAAGFDLENSDTEALALADEVMNAMGGYANWKATRYISWTFLNGRKLLWDKWEGNVRVVIPKYIGKMPLEEDSVTILVNIHDSTGRASVMGEEVTDKDELQNLIHKGISAWINDSYWLIMPFKLKDSGVTLTYLGERPLTEDSTTVTDVLQLTFKDVGETPNHKYHVYIDKDTKLVCQWDYFSDNQRATPNFYTPWLDYQIYGNIKLSGNRGRAELSDIKILEKVDNKLFTDF